MTAVLAAVALLGGLAFVSFVAGAEFSDEWTAFRRRLLSRLMPPHPGGHASHRGHGAADAVPPAGQPGGFPCCECCLQGSPCDPRDSHLTPCDDCGAPALTRPETSLLTPPDGTPAAVSHAQAMHAASLPYLPPVPADRPVAPVQAGPAPWGFSTDSFPALDPDKERARRAFARTELEKLGDDPTATGVGRVMAALRALPAGRADTTGIPQVMA